MGDAWPPEESQFRLVVHDCAPMLELALGRTMWWYGVLSSSNSLGN